jgi:cobalt-zinc-cadmium efflux system outer membrane protein
MRSFCSPILLFKMAFAAVLSYASSVHAAPPTLKDAIEAAWVRQPEARALEARQEEIAAKRDAAAALFPAPPSLELAQRTDQFQQDLGATETEVALSVPLWMPDTKEAAKRLVSVEAALQDAINVAARLRVAGEVREAYWQARIAQNDSEIAARKVKEAAALMQDVERRFKAGDLARTDLNQAKGAERLAKASAAEAHTQAMRAQRLFTALTGMEQLPAAGEQPVDARLSSLPHPQLAILQATVQTQRARLAQVIAQRREAPEVSLGWQRERSVLGENYENSVRLAVRIPLASRTHTAPHITAANAEMMEAEAALALEQDRMKAEIEATNAHLAQARTVASLAQERYQLANETHQLLSKAFQLGELDLPTLLRSENERFDAELALSRAQLAVESAISRTNQALGLLP